MGTVKFIPKEIKEQILRRIKEEGVIFKQKYKDRLQQVRITV